MGLLLTITGLLQWFVLKFYVVLNGSIFSISRNIVYAIEHPFPPPLTVNHFCSLASSITCSFHFLFRLFRFHRCRFHIFKKYPLPKDFVEIGCKFVVLFLLARVSIIVWLKSFILIASYQLYLCFTKFYFVFNPSFSTSVIISSFWLCSQRCQSTNLLMVGLNPNPSKTLQSSALLSKI